MKKHFFLLVSILSGMGSMAYSQALAPSAEIENKIEFSLSSDYDYLRTITVSNNLGIRGGLYFVIFDNGTICSVPDNGGIGFLQTMETAGIREVSYYPPDGYVYLGSYESSSDTYICMIRPGDE